MNKDVVVRLRMTQEEANDLDKKVKLTGLTKSSFIRVLIKGYIPKPKPDPEFYVLLRKLYAVCNDLSQLTAKAHTLNFIDVPMLKELNVSTKICCTKFRKNILLLTRIKK